MNAFAPLTMAPGFLRQQGSLWAVGGHPAMEASHPQTRPPSGSPTPGGVGKNARDPIPPPPPERIMMPDAAASWPRGGGGTRQFGVRNSGRDEFMRSEGWSNEWGLQSGGPADNILPNVPPGLEYGRSGRAYLEDQSTPLLYEDWDPREGNLASEVWALGHQSVFAVGPAGRPGQEEQPFHHPSPYQPPGYPDENFPLPTDPVDPGWYGDPFAVPMPPLPTDEHDAYVALIAGWLESEPSKIRRGKRTDEGEWFIEMNYQLKLRQMRDKRTRMALARLMVVCRLMRLGIDGQEKLDKIMALFRSCKHSYGHMIDRLWRYGMDYQHWRRQVLRKTAATKTRAEIEAKRRDIKEKEDELTEAMLNADLAGGNAGEARWPFW